MASRRDPPSSVTPFPRATPPAAGGLPAVVETGPDMAHIHEQVTQIAEGLIESLALIQAIDLGELLSAAPPAPADRKRHETAVGLLSIQDRLLQELLVRCQRLQALE
ncbi:hypothetical protein QO010_002004 [Caulobacter ginsengisoli]|uniref:Uncharacterized protein n=1 Tax=Caulobacter ginsengisoli TaxID=400775 RepID=A0ABU0IQD6_9CAUL|nr:hypothetical protein [Caulobacter ginsengisoli]MDQ0464223.1 hypothetical protein [Caulobacter ginsengisoli]